MVPDRDAVSLPESTITTSSTSSEPASQSPSFSIPFSTLDELHVLNGRIAELTTEQLTLTNEMQQLHREMKEMQRMNEDLQDQNANYEVLLGERMLNGLGSLAESGLNKGHPFSSSSTGLGVESVSEGGRSRTPSSLSKLEEEQYEDGPEIHAKESSIDAASGLESSGDDLLASRASAARSPFLRLTKRSNDRDEIQVCAGASDLDAELRRAETEEAEREKLEAVRQKAAASAARRKANQSEHLGGRDGDPIPSDFTQLKEEIKLLRQENKGVRTEEIKYYLGCEADED